MQILCREHPVHGHLHTTYTLIQAVLGVSQISAGNLGIVHRNPHQLQELPRADHHRLCHPRDGTHTLRHDAQVAALFDDAAHLPHAIQVRGKILLGNDLRQLQEQANRKTNELIVSHHIIEFVGIARRPRKLVVHAGSMVADENKGILILAGVGLKAERCIDPAVEDLHHLHEDPIQQSIGQLHLPLKQLFLQCLFHRASPLLIYLWFNIVKVFLS